MNFLKKFISVFTASALCFSFAACNSAINDTSWIMKSNDMTVPAGIYILNIMDSVSEAENLIEDEDTTIPVYEKKVEGKNGLDWIKDKAIEKTKKYIAIEQKFNELGLSLTSEDLSSVKSMVDYYWDYYGLSEAYQANGVSKSSFEKSYKNSFMSNKIFSYYYDKDGIEEVPEEELNDYFAENYLNIKVIKMPFKNSANTDLEDKQKADIKNLANAYVERIDSGEEMDVLIDEFEDFVAERDGTSSDTTSDAASSDTTSDTASSDTTSDTISSGTASDTASSDTASDTDEEDEDEDDDPNMQTIKNDSTSYPENVMEAIKSAEYGKGIFVEAEDAYYVVVRYDITEDENNIEDFRSTLLYDIKNDEFNEKVLGWANSLTDLIYNESSLSRYTAKSLK